MGAIARFATRTLLLTPPVGSECLHLILVVGVKIGTHTGRVYRTLGLYPAPLEPRRQLWDTPGLETRGAE